jgi:hypothetical protein
MRAIPTIYRGVKFRSRLEARWAEFFDMIGVGWEFEPEGYTLADGSLYLPDFWLAHIRCRGKEGGLFFEVKPSSPTEGERHKANLLAWGSQKPVVVVERSPGPGCTESFLEFVGGLEGWQDEGLSLARCDNCGQVDIGFYASHESVCPCGKATFNPFNGPLETARQAFPNLGRWEKAA